MPIFAPAYHQSKSHQSYLARQQHLASKKRKRGESGDNNDTASQSSADDDLPAGERRTSFHPVNKTDPYHVAGYSREDALPPSPFPHAAAKEPSKKKLPVEEQLAALNPPLYVAPTSSDDTSTSLKRRHLDNLTTILHRCMLNGDWTRAARAWSLLLRTEIDGRGIDVRRSGRWGIGAEILMRGGTKNPTATTSGTNDEDASPSPSDHNGPPPSQTQFSDDGFTLAREYYERLILQYPHTPYTQRGLNATSVYPALFNIWIYEVQDRSQQARKRLHAVDVDNPESSRDSIDSNDSNDKRRDQLRQARIKELDQALPIAIRIDELLLSPPYDTSASLLQLRGMVALWISDLHAELAGPAENRTADSDNSFDDTRERHQEESRMSLSKASDIFSRLMASGSQLPQGVLDLLDEDEE